ncbi:hypothetical protein ACLOJK_026775, partial [Asimina triloba]
TQEIKKIPLRTWEKKRKSERRDDRPADGTQLEVRARDGARRCGLWAMALGVDG